MWEGVRHLGVLRFLVSLIHWEAGPIFGTAKDISEGAVLLHFQKYCLGTQTIVKQRIWRWCLK